MTVDTGVAAHITAMHTFTQHTGNLFDSDATALGHGVNTEGRMGAGIAVAFRNADPDMYEAYRQECWSGRLRAGTMFAYPGPRWVYNIASQDRPGAHARLDWLDTGVQAALAHARDHAVDSLALPRIGCGIGGLSWDKVSTVLARAAARSGVKVEVWTL